MITCKAIDRTPDRKIYKLIDTNGKTIDMKVEELREGIRTGKLNVVNITMGSDGRIVVNENKGAKKEGNGKAEKQEKSAPVPQSLYDLVKNSKNVNVVNVINKARQMGLQIRRIATKDSLFTLLVSEGNNHILCIPDGVVHLGNIVSKKNTRVEENGCEFFYVTLDNLNTLSFTQYLQKLEGNIIVVGGSTLENANYMFADCNFNEIDLRHFNTSNVTSMKGMFYACKVRTLNLSTLNTRKVMNIRLMFAYSEIETGIDLSSFDTSNAIDMSYMFLQIGNNNIDVAIEGFSNFSFKNATKLVGMFAWSCCNVTTFKYGPVNMEKGAVDMRGMFCGPHFEVIDFSNSYIGDNSDLSYMFASGGADNITFAGTTFGNDVKFYDLFASTDDIYINNFDFSNVTTKGLIDATKMFACCHIENINMSNNTKIRFKKTRGMFFATEAKNLDLRAFDTSAVTDMVGMFCLSNIDVLDASSFDTSSVTNMSHMFMDCGARYLDLSNFRTGHISGSNMASIFDNFRGEITTSDSKIMNFYLTRDENAEASIIEI